MISLNILKGKNKGYKMCMSLRRELSQSLIVEGCHNSLKRRGITFITMSAKEIRWNERPPAKFLTGSDGTTIRGGLPVALSCGTTMIQKPELTKTNRNPGWGIDFLIQVAITWVR